MNTFPTDYQVVQAMIRYGGSFAAAIGAAFRVADPENEKRLREAFPDLWQEYADMAVLIEARRLQAS